MSENTPAIPVPATAANIGMRLSSHLFAHDSEWQATVGASV